MGLLYGVATDFLPGFCRQKIMNIMCIAHMIYLPSDSKAGSIFMDYRMAGDFSSPYSVIYGHNVRDGSMLL